MSDLPQPHLQAISAGVKLGVLVGSHFTFQSPSPQPCTALRSTTCLADVLADVKGPLA